MSWDFLLIKTSLILKQDPIQFELYKYSVGSLLRYIHYRTYQILAFCSIPDIYT